MVAPSRARLCCAGVGFICFAQGSHVPVRARFLHGYLSWTLEASCVSCVIVSANNLFTQRDLEITMSTAAARAIAPSNIVDLIL